MCNKKEKKRDRRWYLFPVSTLGAVYFAVHGGTGRVCFSFEAGRGVFFFSEAGRGVFFFPRRDGAFFFFSRRDGVAFFFFFDGTGRGGVFFFFRGPGRDGCFWRWHFFGRDGAKPLHLPAKGGLNRPASRPCKLILPSFEIGALVTCYSAFVRCRVFEVLQEYFLSVWERVTWYFLRTIYLVREYLLSLQDR